MPKKVTKNITLYAKWTESTKDNSEKNRLSSQSAIKTRLFFGTEKSNDVAPKIVNNRTMLPARFAAENLGALVLWDEEKELVTIKGKNLETNEDVEILITIGAENAVVNGKEVKLDSPAFVENDRTYTPIRFISEELGAKVEWIESEQKGCNYSKIRSKTKPPVCITQTGFYFAYCFFYYFHFFLSVFPYLYSSVCIFPGVMPSSFLNTLIKPISFEYPTILAT
ncbi:MAG: copper amine oxidase N-terminal domain-containing protein [Clostridiales bacterium]|nr:MAG: copper amine oxidase N-terminal domain-containing protein [Clostridiales bacterium]